MENYPAIMTPRIRRFILTLHILFSVGWFGAVLAYLALAITGLVSPDNQLIKVVYPALALVGWYVIIPSSLAAMLTGLIQSLGTHWGLFRYYWIFLKFLLTFVASIILVNHMPVVSRMAGLVAKGMVSGPDFDMLRHQLLIHAAGGLVILMTTTVLSVYKPWGKINYQADRKRLYLSFGLVCLVLLFVVVHLLSGGMHNHH